MTGDPVRFGAVWLAIDDIEKTHIAGAFAEAGVYQGKLSRYIHENAPGRKLYLFDTFEGFPGKYLKGKKDERFTDTSAAMVREILGDSDNILIRKGVFPETARDLDKETFAFVSIDFDLYESTLAALRFFYPRMSKGGYIFLHDYANPESEFGVSKATSEFLGDKPGRVIRIPDACGSAIIKIT
ncbi:MAG: macrocin O-methyltransferase [Candidatus Omnitrophica bacterium]|nr:macrocin O-methyltransferase [Candidatus Omnitrophota bacterium]